MGVALVTGAGGILGRHLAVRLASSGWSVALVDRHLDPVEEVSAEIASSGGSARPYRCDITDPDAMHELHDRVLAELGSVETLVNNAATKSDNFFEPFESFPLSDWNDVLNVNLNGAMLACQTFGSSMAARESGSIVNILSIYGIVAPDQRIYEGSEYQGRAINTPAIYSASKAALLGLTRYLAAYWGSLGVRVNAVTPGGVFSGQNSTFSERYSARVPMNRMAEPEEVADAVEFLTSERSSYVNGHNLVVDGGLTVW